MQVIRALRRPPTNGVTAIILTPMVRAQNRANTAAFSEHELSYFPGDAENLRDIAAMRPSVGSRALGQVFFMNVVRGAAGVIQNVTRTPRNARDFED